MNHSPNKDILEFGYKKSVVEEQPHPKTKKLIHKKFKNRMLS
jgi:hypothetical protein